MRICGICFTAAFLVRLSLRLAGYNLAGYVLTPARMDELAVGAFLAVVARQRGGLFSLSRWARPVGVAAVTVLEILIWRYGFGPTETMGMQTLGFTALAVAFGAMLSVAVSSPVGSGTAKFFAHPFLVFFGRYSYAIYVFHHPIMIFMKQRIANRPLFWGSQLPAEALFIATATLTSVSLAMLSWHFYEAPFLRLKALFPYSPTRQGLKH